MSMLNPESVTRLSFAGDLTLLIRYKLLQATGHRPYPEGPSLQALDNVGFFCIEPLAYLAEQLTGADAFSISYTGFQENLDSYESTHQKVRSTATSLKLFKAGHPYTFNESNIVTLGNDHSVFAGGDSPPIIVNQASLELAADQLDLAISGLGNWQVMSHSERLQDEGIAQVLTDDECRNIIAAIAKSNVDGQTLLSALKSE